MGGPGAVHSALASPETFSKAIGISPALIIDNLISNDIDYTHGSKHFLQRTFGNFNKLQTSPINPKVLYERNERNNYKNPSFYIAIGKDDFLLKMLEPSIKWLVSK